MTANTPVLAWQLTIRPNLLERWQYVIDAQTGAILTKFNNTCGLDGPVQASARDLNGITRTFQTYLQNGQYFLIDAGRPMFNNRSAKMPDEPVGTLWTIDAANTFGDNIAVQQISGTTNNNWSANATSAHYNAGIAYDYYRTVFGRNSLNGKGGNIISVVNIADDDGKGGMDNAYWNGEYMGYGNGRTYFKPLAGALDVAGHEMTHGVIQNSANLTYQNQSGAINESMADVFGAMIDRNNWQIGEGVVKSSVFLSGAIRDLSNPNQGGVNDPGYQPRTMAQYISTSDDNGGVHINSGIPNWAFYKFATAVGKDKAEKVYYRTLTTYLTRSSKFVDLRLAVIKAAGDLFGATGAEVTAAKTAFDAVGIVEPSSTTPPDKNPTLPTNTGGDLILLTDATDNKLYSTVVNSTKFDLKASTGLTHRPSVTDNGLFAYYVSPDKRIRRVNLAGSPVETVVSNETVWDNVAISKDGNRLAALTDQADASVWVYSFPQKQWKTFKLFNPTTSKGVTTGEVQYADSFEWDYTGEYIVYDAYNALKNPQGKAIDYWDLGFIRAWNSSKNDFGDGSIDKLFASLDEGESIGNPTYAKNSPNVMAFDYEQTLDGTTTNYVVATNLEIGTVNGIYKNNTLGYPNYSRSDDRLVFDIEATGGEEDVATIALQADKITPSGSATTLYKEAKWPVWFSQAARVLPTKTAQTLTFNALDDRYAGDPDFILAATSSANLPVSFAMVSGPAVLAGNRVSLTGVGVVKVRAYQEGNSQFYAATAIDRTFTVLAILGAEPTVPDALKVYPNPATGQVTVDMPVGVSWQSLRLNTTLGGLVQQQANGGQSSKAVLDISQLPAGVYMLRIETSGGPMNRKVLKQ